MTTHRARIGILVTLAGVLLGAGGAYGSDGKALTVSVDRALISTKLGHKFVFRSTIANGSATAAAGLIAHLNVLSLRSDTYVDPEDWSSHRTRYLASIPAGGSTTITWQMEAVNHGSFAVYVAVVPQSGMTRPPATGPAIRVAVADRKTLNSGGILPLALGIPALLGGLTFGLRLRRARA